MFPQNRASSAAVFPRLTPDNKALEYNNLSRRNSGSDLTWLQLAEISLWASGDINASNLQRIRNAVTQFQNSVEQGTSSKEIAESILTFMHRNFLRNYTIQQTRVDTIFSNGRFNCVSSSILYIILCESVGIKTSGVITKDHAFVMVHINGENIDVETTNRYGFDPGNRKEFHDQFGRLTGFTYVPAQNYQDRQTISNFELISLILNNRIAELERRNNFAEAVPLAIDRAALLLGDLSFASSASYSLESIFTNPIKDLTDRLLNYGAALLRSNREEDGIRWAISASSMYSGIEYWQDFLLAAINNRITRFIRERKMTDARNFLEEYKNILTETNYSHLDTVIQTNLAIDYHNRFASEWNRRSYSEAERIL
ncbi:MAG: hypothetical protein FWD24_05510, partial [Treponema sp.]|nr:hypothetical protein [Treponema sp.]